METLAKRAIVVGVTGGIAAYKSADLVRRLRERGAQVRVAMTANAGKFISPLTMQALSGHPVHEHLLDAQAESAMDHIALARWADAIVVAPASANFIARLAHGFADDLLTTVCLATTARLALAPAMNRQMWDNPATRANVERLRERAVAVLGPGTGSQACGEVGPGRMLEPEQLATAIEGLFAAPVLAGTRVLITAGPTWEALDPVRGLTNLSSGKMGYAVAAAAVEAGAQVVLVSGPTALEPPFGAELVSVTSGVEMHEAVQSRIADSDIFIAVAAVADYRPDTARGTKIKRDADSLVLRLVKNPDILASVAHRDAPPYTVGFAAETTDLRKNARNKLLSKGVDLIAANRVGDGLGIGADTNALTLIGRDTETELGPVPKTVLARQLVAEIARHFHAKGPAQTPRRTAGL